MTFAARVKEAEAALRIAQAGARVQLASKERAAAEISAARMARRVAEANQAALTAKLGETERDVKRKLILARTMIISKSDLTGTQARRDAEAADVLAATEQINMKGEAIVVAEADLKIAEANLDNAQAIVEEKEAALDQAEQDLARTEIRSPIDGVIIKRDINPGQTVAVSLEAKMLFNIANDLSEMEVHGKLDEADIGQVKPGQKVAFTVDAYPERQFEADVRQVRMAHEVVQNVVTYTVVISASNLELLLFPGMTANLVIRIDESADVLKIPNQALRFRPGGEPPASENSNMTSGVVWVSDPDRQRPVPVPVALGRSDSNGTELRSGSLTEGQPVIVGVAVSEVRRTVWNPSGISAVPEPLIRAVNFDKQYHVGGAVVRAVSDVSFDVEPGEFVAVIGRSGSGKSDSDELARSVGDARRRAIPVEGSRSRQARPEPTGCAALPRNRLRVPDVFVVAAIQRLGKCRTAACLCRCEAPRPATQGTECAGPRRTLSSARALAVSIVRRRAATRGDCPRNRERTVFDPRR